MEVGSADAVLARPHRVARVDAHDSSVLCDELGESPGDVSGAATHVDDAEPDPDVQHLERGRPQALGWPG